MNKKIFKPVLAALFAAIICVATFLIQIPVVVTGGYINMGDCFVLLSGIVLGPVYSFLAAGIGSALADVLFGYFTYAPATFLIKGLMALTVSLLFVKAKDKYSIFKLLFIGLIAETIMVIGYFIYECFVLSYGFGAAMAIPGNIFQGVCGIFVNTLLVQIINKNIKLKNILNWRE